MKLVIKTCTLMALLTGAALAQSAVATPGQELSERIFGSIEKTPSDAIDMGEFITFGNDIFASMDTNESNSIDPKEFRMWDFGFDFIAQDSGQRRAYETAQKIIFANWDHDGNREISKREYRKSMNWDFGRADIDDNALLTKDEFLQGYIVILAYRAAISGQ